MSFSGGTGWFKLATVTMPQSSSVVYISLIGGAGYNVGSPQQAGISELVLRAGNGNPKGLTGALWRRASVGFTNFAWVNTSGDTYDVYVEIGNHAIGVNIQWDYTRNASVTIHTSPTYTADKPTGLTDGTVYVIYSSHIKPTATDVGALPITGGNLKGGLTATGEIISKSANGLRIAYGNYGFFIRNDGSHTFFMLTDSGNSLGTYNNLRPLIINNANGTVTIGNGLNVTGGINGSLNGNAATATKLQTARTIGGVSFDGSANIDLPGVNKAGNQSTTGNAATATKLQTARTIGGVSFDGSANIDLPGVNKAGNQSTTGNAATATKLQTARTINGVSFDGTKDITLTPKDLDAYSKSEVQSALAGKQPLDNTLTNLSGKDVAGLLAYLGLGEGSALPVGVPVPWPLETPPTGWLKCNGAAFSSEMYPKLAKAYPTNKLPDLRGEFIRGWDDGRGVDAGRVILSIQGWLTGSHYHNIRSWDAWDNTVLVPNDRGGDSLLSTDNAVRQGAINGKFTSQYRTELSGGNETRPRNIAFNYIVRAA
ncbi:tail fiber protein [Escherichia coli]|nr:tail fiber protein [Escherichia coli]